MQGQGNQGFRRVVLLYIAQVKPKIDAEIAKKHPFRMKTDYFRHLPESWIEL